MLNFAFIEHLNFDESHRISSFVITTQVIILSGSHWKMKYSTTLILVNGLVKVNGFQLVRVQKHLPLLENLIETKSKYRVWLAMFKLSFAYSAGTHKSLTNVGPHKMQTIVIVFVLF